MRNRTNALLVPLQHLPIQPRIEPRRSLAFRFTHPRVFHLAAVAALIWVLSLTVGAFAGKSDDVFRVARALLRDSNYKVRVHAATVLGRMGDPRANVALVKALDDPNHTVRAMAARSLGQLGLPEAEKPLKKDSNRRKTPSFATILTVHSMRLPQRRRPEPRPSYV